MILKFVLFFWVLLACINPTDVAAQTTVAEKEAEKFASSDTKKATESAERESFVLKLRLARLRAETFGRNHPQYEQAQKYVRDLESQLQIASEPPVQSAEPIDASTNRVTSKFAATKPKQDVKIAKSVVTSDSFQIVGGWQLPSQGAGGKGLGYSRGGLYVEHGVGSERSLFTFGHQQSSECHVLEVSLKEIGTDTNDRLAWPVAKPIKLLKGSHTIADNNPYSLCRPNPGGAFLTTGRVYYATDPGNWIGPWMNWFDETNNMTTPMAVESHVNRRQVFGGGFCEIPSWYAKQFLEGRKFGVGFGGYRSGQGSSPGPTFFAADWPTDQAKKLNNCVELLSFQWGGGKDRREERPADYTKPLWGPAVENGIGWWQGDEVIAGPVWVDTPDVTGLCYWSVQGLGALNYNLQTTVASRERRVRLYVYDPADLAQVARGEVRPYQVRGSYFEWDLPFDDGPNASRWPIGAYWDADDQLLYISYQNSGGGQFEIPPAVVVYRIGSQ
ncbi:hypothetical protein Q31b_18830 [Novipirellula aureliae]|uniref:Uncharacterized protein n=1 Tax=Novipirellula aureliae TaxID=2527966 RepID=A0A5C6E8Y3_9BACT|nr:hypothetical protein [Novipirellula aureliae]TWU44347.1 hypothetical protein Q31b_18830 [Novipirellula aureliae]